jgi:hypothetical protein
VSGEPWRRVLTPCEHPECDQRPVCCFDRDRPGSLMPTTVKKSDLLAHAYNRGISDVREKVQARYENNWRTSALHPDTDIRTAARTRSEAYAVILDELSRMVLK